MKINEQIIRTLTPKDGYVLTQAAQVPLADRTFSSKVYLAKSASADDFTEITIADAETLKAQQKQEQIQAQAERERESKKQALLKELKKLEESE